MNLCRMCMHKPGNYFDVRLTKNIFSFFLFNKKVLSNNQINYPHKLICSRRTPLNIYVHTYKWKQVEIK